MLLFPVLPLPVAWHRPLSSMFIPPNDIRVYLALSSLSLLLIIIVFIVDLPPFSLAGTLIASEKGGIVVHTSHWFCARGFPASKKITQMRAFSCIYQKKIVPLRAYLKQTNINIT